MTIIGLSFGASFSIGSALGNTIVLIIDKFQLFQGSYMFGITLMIATLNLLNFILVTDKLPKTYDRSVNVGYMCIGIASLLINSVIAQNQKYLQRNVITRLYLTY